MAKFFGPAEVLGLPKIVSLWESPGHRWVNCEGIQCFIYPRPGPNACGFWLSLWVFIDSYELTIEEPVAIKLCQYQTLLNTGQQVAVFHITLHLNLHTKH